MTLLLLRLSFFLFDCDCDSYFPIIVSTDDAPVLFFLLVIGYIFFTITYIDVNNFLVLSYFVSLIFLVLYMTLTLL